MKLNMSYLRQRMIHLTTLRDSMRKLYKMLIHSSMRVALAHRSDYSASCTT